MTNYSIIPKNDSDYPSLLKEIRNPPEQLYGLGDLFLLKSACIAVVGTRAYTPYGKSLTDYFAEGLVSYGFTIVSGLAFGIDAIAHRATLKNQGKTIAVLGNGITEIYPIEHTNLAQEILEKGGAIVSEYPPNTPGQKHHFPQRNRIISGLSLATLIIEASEKSGALITARFAFDQNRDVFAAPGDLFRETFKGNLNLIANDMARLVRTPEDVVAALREQPFLPLQRDVSSLRQKREPPLTTRAQKLVWQNVSWHPISNEEILEKTQLTISETTIALSYLELKGYIKNMGFGRYQKI